MGTASHEAQLPVLEDIGLRAVGQLNVREIRTSQSLVPWRSSLTHGPKRLLCIAGTQNDSRDGEPVLLKMKLGDTGRIKLPLPRRSANGDWQVARQWKLDSVASCKSSVNHGVWTFVLNFVGGQTRTFVSEDGDEAPRFLCNLLSRCAAKNGYMPGNNLLATARLALFSFTDAQLRGFGGRLTQRQDTAVLTQPPGSALSPPKATAEAVAVAGTLTVREAVPVALQPLLLEGLPVTEHAQFLALPWNFTSDGSNSCGTYPRAQDGSSDDDEPHLTVVEQQWRADHVVRQIFQNSV